MEFRNTFVILLTSFLFFNSKMVISEEIKAEFNYMVGSKIGPLYWGDIRKDWATCNNGSMQSPIDLTIKPAHQAHQLDLKDSHLSACAVIKNRGHDIMLEWEEDAGGIWINGTLFSLKQLHWHTPSEHTINGRRYSMEVHMVHQRACDKKIAVVGILYKVGRPDTFLNEMMKYIRMVKDREDSEVKVGIVDPSDVKKGSRKFFRYMGSLTTPPCSEGVVWTIINKVRTVSKEQLSLLKEAVIDGYERNARPTQPINGRVVQLYKQSQ